jgi:hypothetical protein
MLKHRDICTATCGDTRDTKSLLDTACVDSEGHHGWLSLSSLIAITIIDTSIVQPLPCSSMAIGNVSNGDFVQFVTPYVRDGSYIHRKSQLKIAGLSYR